MKLKKVLSSVLSLSLVLSSFNVTFASQQVSKTELLKQKAKNFYSSNVKKIGDIDFRRALQQKYGEEYEEFDNLPKEEKFNEKVRVIVEVDSPSALELLKQKNLSLSNLKLQESKVEDSQKNVINKLKMYGQIRHTYKSVLNGFSMVVNYKDIENIKKIPGIKKVTVANVYYLDMSSAKGLTNTERVWEELGFKGEGMVISIVDTGIDYNHKDMKLTDPSKAKLNKIKVEEMGGPGKFYTDKVPYGYNFADLNDEVIDRTSSMHGMHVGGIVAANGEIKGVAPEAQLLAMKVFSNNPELRGAYTDDIAAAIEDSIKHGADVINMSLGSTAGFVMPDDPEQRAIKNATDAGVLVVVSGGNSYYSTYGYYYPYTIDPDMGLVGSPGLFPDTLQVASSENSKITLPALNYRYTIAGKEFSGLMGYTMSEVDPTTLKGEYEIVYCGLGKPEEFIGKDLTGKIALIERGVISFVDKKLNAQNAGAIGVIIFNSTAGGETYINMATDPRVLIPAVFVKRSDGLKLKNNVSTARVSFKKKTTILSDNATKNRMSDFSSWGTAPDLSFKPDISAPGGQIYSTVNDDKYETMSGTSMAAPHASGSAALVIQALKKNNPNLSGRVLVERAKILLSNSAEQLMDTNALPYSPRKQGAGLIKTDKAINAKAYVVNGDGKPNIALKDFTGNKEFTIKIKNISNDELTFKLSNPFGVLSNSKIGDMFINIKEANINGASLQFEKDEVTVKGNEEAEVKITLNVDSFVPQNIFLEGFIKIEEKENKTPAMTIPFIGFYGKWDEVRVLDSPIWEDDSYYGVACLTDKNGYYLGYVGFDFNTLMPIVSPDMISISPNGDGLFDNVQPNLTFLRNAKEFRVELLDENKNVLRELSYDVNIRKNLGTQYTPAYMNPNWVWDGTLYDVLGNQSVAKEGQYYLRFKSRVDYEGAKWQEVEMPVKVDLTAPEVKVDATKKEGNVFNFNFEGSKDNVGIYGYLIIRGENDNNPEFISALNIEKDVYIPQGINEVAVAALDFAGNIGLEIVKLDNQFITIKKPLETQFEPALGYEVTNRLTPFEFEISPSAKYFLSKVLMTIEKIGNTNKIEKELTDNILDLTKENLEDGQYSLTVALFDKENKCFASVGQKFILDTKAPEFEGLEDKVIEKSSTKYNLEFTVKDNLTGYTLYLNGDLVDVNASQKLEGSIKKYNIPVDVKIGKNEFEFKIVDFAGNQTVKKVKLNVKKIEEINVFVEKDNVVYNTKTAKIVGKIETNKAYDGMYVLVKHNIAKDDATLEEVEDGRFNVINDGTFNIEVSTDSFKVEKYEYQIIKDDEILFEGNFNVCFFPIEVLSPLYFNTNKKEYNLKFKVSEEYNYDKVEIVLNDEVIKTIEKKDINGEVEFKVTGLEKGYNLIGLNVVNEKSAWGIGMINVYVDQDFPTVTVYDEFGNNLSSTPFYNQNNVKIFGFINEELKSLKINGDPVDIAEGAFNKEIVLNEGLNRIFFEIEDMAGNINKYVYKVYCDTVAPCVDTLNYKKDIVVVENDKLELNFKAQDNTLGYRVYINNNQVFTEENEVATGVSKEYSYTINLKEGLNVVRLDVVDFAGNTSGKVIYVYNRINYPISIDNFLSFDRTSDKDLEVELYIPNEYDRNIKQVVLINNNSTNNIVVENTNYELKENKLFVKSEYLKKLDRGNYVLQVEFTNGDKLGFTVNVFDERNSNANLKAIYVNGEELKLNKNGEYVYEVEMEKEYIVTAEAEDNKAKVEITQAQTLPGIAKIKVTAEDGTVVNYEVKLIYPIELSVEDKVEFKAGQDAKVRVNAKNVTLAERVATLIVGLFDEHNRLVQYVSGKYTIKPNDTVQMGANLKLGSNTKGYKIKTFIWELEENMKILSKSFEFIVK